MELNNAVAAPASWMVKVADVLPLPLHELPPYTLCEAAEELALWARTAGTSAWGRKENRASLFDDVTALVSHLGPRLGRLMRPYATPLCAATPRVDLAKHADVLIQVWREPATILAAFDDLCERSRRPSATSRALVELAAPLRSQLFDGVPGGWSVLREAVTALAGEPLEQQVKGWFGVGASLATVTSAQREVAARAILSAGVPIGDTVVWLLYDRAQIPWRVIAGDVTFYQAEWFVPNARRPDGQDFERRDEFRSLLDGVWWADDLDRAVEEPANHIALVRVALGTRRAVGAVEEAVRRVEAMLSIAVDSGGVSWRPTGTNVIVRDGEIVSSTQGRPVGAPELSFTDTYGIEATAKALEDVATQLADALAREPLPERLREAVLALREAGMTDHRDVIFYGQRPVRPRVATALEDHALESIASQAAMTSDELAEALVIEEVDRRFHQHFLASLMAPLDDYSSGENGEERRAIELAVSRREGGRRVVTVADVVSNRKRVEALGMSELQRADLDLAFAVLTDPNAERRLTDSITREVDLLRRRYRRVRNAVTHGNPLSTAALASIREFGDETAHEALRRALGAFANGTPLSSAFADLANGRKGDRVAMGAGSNYLDRASARIT